jgi:hypothetical protein
MYKKVDKQGGTEKAAKLSLCIGKLSSQRVGQSHRRKAKKTYSIL